MPKIRRDQIQAKGNSEDAFEDVHISFDQTQSGLSLTLATASCDHTNLGTSSAGIVICGKMRKKAIENMDKVDDQLPGLAFTTVP